MPSTVLRNMTLDRQHRFQVGDEVRHADTTADRSNVAVVEELTWRVTADPETGQWIGYPTYTIVSVMDATDEVDDVLCTNDLIPRLMLTMGDIVTVAFTHGRWAAMYGAEVRMVCDDEVIPDRTMGQHDHGWYVFPEGTSEDEGGPMFFLSTGTGVVWGPDTDGALRVEVGRADVPVYEGEWS